MEKLDLSLVIMGKICSGKSTLANDFRKWLKVPIASFGGYLKHYSLANGLPTERETLQELGDSFIEKSHFDFLQNVMSFSSSDTSQFIFEGVRHKVILDEINRISNRTFSIFLDAKEDVRLDRFIKREKDIDKTSSSPEDFYRLSGHPVEREVDSLKEFSNFVIYTNESYQDFLRALSLYK